MTNSYVALALLIGVVVGLVVGYNLAPDTSIWHCVKPL